MPFENGQGEMTKYGFYDFCGVIDDNSMLLLLLFFVSLPSAERH